MKSFIPNFRNTHHDDTVTLSKGKKPDNSYKLRAIYDDIKRNSKNTEKSTIPSANHSERSIRKESNPDINRYLKNNQKSSYNDSKSIILGKKNVSNFKDLELKPQRSESKLVNIIKSIINSTNQAPKKSIFKFENTPEAASHNTKILASSNFDYEKILNKQKNTIISYGSEFRSCEILHNLLKFHKSGQRIKSTLTNGTDTVLSPLDEDTLKKDCLANLERGNHISSTRSKDDINFVQKTYKKEVEKGWMIPFSKNIIHKIKNACVIPIGTVHQMTIDEEGNPMEKRRLTHDCSWKGPASSHSINSRINEELLEPLQYGRCMYRVLHNIQYMRFKNPSKKLLMAKHDLDSAYRRLHWHAKCALLCITVLGSTAYLLTRLCFGIASGPSKWHLISEAIVDFATALISDPSWDPMEVFNPIKEIPTDIEFLDDSIPLVQTKNIIREIPTKDCYIDGYIDDMITIIIAIDYLIRRAIQIIPLLV